MKYSIPNHGQALVELLLALSLTAILLPALITGFVASREGNVQQRERLQAVSIVREAREAVRMVRESGWANIATDGTFHPVASGSAWILVPGSEVVDGQTRSIVIADANRDVSGAIVINGGTPDPSTKAITVTASWNALFPSSVTSTLYLTRYDNQKYIQTTYDDFSVGESTGTIITNNYGGEVTLGAGGTGNWCAPDLSIAAVDLPKSGVANAVSAIEGRVFAGTGDNASGVSFANVNITNADPPTAQSLGTFDGYKTNGIYGETNYAYLATDNNFKEIVIIDLTNTDPVTGKYLEAGYFNAPGNGSAASVYVSGTIGYALVGNTLYTFDVTEKTGSRAKLGSQNLTANGTHVVVNGQYAYISLASTTEQLQIIQIDSDGKTLTSVGSAAVVGLGATYIALNSTATRGYLITGVDAVKNEFFIINLSGKTGIRPVISSFDTNGMSPKAVTPVTNNKLIIGGSGGTEYQVLDLTNESTPIYCGGMNINSGVNGVAAIVETDGDVYSYIITGDATSELKIIRGGPGGVFSSGGIFESSIFDASQSATFNRFDVHTTVPFQSSITYQVAIADAVNGSCSGAAYTFVGPDKTSSTYFATSSAIPLSTGPGYKNPGRCMRYRTFLDSQDIFVSPIFEDITFNYSP